MYPIKPPGRPTRATPEFIAQIKQAVQTNPLTLGYGFSTWSATRLAEHLAKVTGIHFSDDQLRRLLHQHGFSVHRPKHTLKGKRDEAAYRKAKAELTELLPGAVFILQVSLSSVSDVFLLEVIDDDVRSVLRAA